MGLEIFLIDFENVQPSSLGRLAPGTCSIKLFLGETQNKVPLALTRALQPFGADVEYLTITGTGPNAVDFHIAFYIGRLAMTHPGARFTIVSRDTGFDPLVRHMVATLSIPCRRVAALPAAPATTVSIAASATANPAQHDTAKVRATAPAPARPAPASKAKNVQVTVLAAAATAKSPMTDAAAAEVARFTEAVIARLKGMKAAKPATLKTLTSSVTSWAVPPIDAPAIRQVLATLVDRKVVSVQGTRISYRLK